MSASIVLRVVGILAAMVMIAAGLRSVDRRRGQSHALTGLGFLSLLVGASLGSSTPAIVALAIGVVLLGYGLYRRMAGSSPA